MKTKIKIMAMLMSMIIGTLTVSAQSAKRGNSEQKRTTSTRQAVKKPTKKTNSSVARKPQATRQTQPAARRSTQQPQRSKAVQTQRNSNFSREVAARSTQRGPKTQTTAYRSNSKGMSTTNRHNPKSTYRAPNKTVHVGKTFSDPKPGNRYGNQQAGSKTYRKTNHSKNVTVNRKHHYYPAKKVKIHVHPMTYRGNYRALYYPRYSEIVWTRSMHRHYVGLYPYYSGWHYNLGYRIQTISAFDASYNAGEIARVYGRVYATWYNQESDDLLLFFGGEYPNQAFTMIIPGRVARRYSWRPERYFLGQHVAATGLITVFEGRAEMVLKQRSQISVY